MYILFYEASLNIYYFNLYKNIFFVKNTELKNKKSFKKKTLLSNICLIYNELIFNCY